MQNKNQTINKTQFSGYKGTVQMLIPAGGAHVRQVLILIPELFTSKPTLSLTVYPTNGNGTMFVIYDITIVQSGNQTEIKVTAQNTVLAQQLPNLIVMLDYFVVG
jgi:hypothetical protein